MHFCSIITGITFALLLIAIAKLPTVSDSYFNQKGLFVFTMLSRYIVRRGDRAKKPEANYKAIFDAANDAIFVHDPKSGKILDANKHACEMYGWTIEEIRRLSVGDLSADDPLQTNESAQVLLEKAASGFEPSLFEWRAKDRKGHIFWVEVNLKRAVLNSKEVVLAVVRDITSRKRMMDDLRQSEQRFVKAFIANPQPMSVTTIADGRYLDVNDSFLSISGYRRDEVIGHTSLELRIWETPEKREEFIGELLISGAVKNAEMLFRTKAGSFRTFLSSAEQLKISGTDCVLVASSDITDLRAAERAAHQTLLELGGRLIQAQEEERKRVARELHDDLSQKMALLSIELDYVSRHTSMPETELRAKMQNLMADAEDISEDLHRISHQLHPSKLDQLGLVKATRNFVEEFGAHYGLTINFHVNGLPTRLPSDESLCAFRIIQEALRNVAKHSGAREAEVSLEKQDQMLKVRVCDSGRGFDTLSNEIINGLGFIGMRERLRSVGGKLSIYSEWMRGTRIEGFIPLKDETVMSLPAELAAERIQRSTSISMQQLFSITDTTLEGV